MDFRFLKLIDPRKKTQKKNIKIDIGNHSKGYTGMKDSLKAIGIGSGIAFSVLAGGFLGYKVGEHFGMEEVGLTFGLFGGFFGAVYNIVRTFSE